MVIQHTAHNQEAWSCLCILATSKDKYRMLEADMLVNVELHLRMAIIILSLFNIYF